MNYNETIGYIHSTPKFARTLGNELLRRLLNKLNNPQDKLKFIHIAGTNGKGSCAVMLAEILKTSGYRVGLFTSPYITCFNERIRIDGEEIPNAKLAEITTRIRESIEKYDTPVSEFALDTAIAFEYFAEEKCDIVVLETGLGGRLDATNVIKVPLITVLMSIGFDHMQYLGDTIEEITAEKCGIIKESRPVIVYPCMNDNAVSVIKKFCAEKNASYIQADMPKKCRGGLIYNKNKYELSLGGDFQIYNAATVLKAAEVLNGLGLNINDTAVFNGLKSAKNPARFETLECGSIIDGAHNKPASAALCEMLKALNQPICLCIAMMADKDISGVVSEFSSLSPYVIATEIPMPRCAAAERISTEFSRHGISAVIEKNPIKAARLALAQADKIPVVCGSLYLAAEIRKNFKSRDD